MQTKILQKCIDALKEQSPNIERVLGMLETLVELQPDSGTKTVPTEKVTLPVSVIAEAGLPTFSSVDVLKAQQNTKHE